MYPFNCTVRENYIVQVTSQDDIGNICDFIVGNV